MPFQPSVIDHFKHFIRRINVWITVGIYSLIAPVGYAILAFLCFCWRRDPIRRARRLQTITANAYRLMHRWLGCTGSPCSVIVGRSKIYPRARAS